MLAQTPPPPYYAVIFSSVRTTVDDGYGVTADRMVELATQQPGFLGVESARDEAGSNQADDLQERSEPLGITVWYWKSLENIQNWRLHAEHTLAREYGRQHWYNSFKLRICLVEREYGFDKA